jgi:hypothetical protein
VRILTDAETGCSAENIGLDDQTEDDEDTVILCFCIDTQPNFHISVIARQSMLVDFIANFKA